MHAQPIFRVLTACTLAATALGFAAPTAFGQGCVAVRGSGMCMLTSHNSGEPDDANLQGGDWLASVSYRYLHSHRHFVGDQEQPQRQIVQANEVINHSHFIDAAIQYAFTPRYSVALTLPYVTSDRSQKAPTNYPSYRYETHAAGFGDVRLTGYGWIWDPTKRPKGNIQVGIGLKAPTGEDGASDIFPTANGPVYKTVDQSIQPGDGGWGVAVELNGYRELFPRTVAFLQASYLLNPQEDNGVLTWRDNNSAVAGAVTAKPDSPSYYEHVMSIPDQYFVRGGLSYVLVPRWGLSVSLAGRLEGIPVNDLIGGDGGFRRPGFSVGIEPGFQIMKGRYTFSVQVPFAVYRNRERSVADQMAAAVAGVDKHGDAAFADYAISANFAVQF